MYLQTIAQGAFLWNLYRCRQSFVGVELKKVVEKL